MATSSSPPIVNVNTSTCGGLLTCCKPCTKIKARNTDKNKNTHKDAIYKAKKHKNINLCVMLADDVIRHIGSLLLSTDLMTFTLTARAPYLALGKERFHVHCSVTWWKLLTEHFNDLAMPQRCIALQRRYTARHSKTVYENALQELIPIDELISAATIPVDWLELPLSVHCLSYISTLAVLPVIHICISGQGTDVIVDAVSPIHALRYVCIVCFMKARRALRDTQQHPYWERDLIFAISATGTVFPALCKKCTSKYTSQSKYPCKWTNDTSSVPERLVLAYDR